MCKENNIKEIAVNRKAFHDYEILEKFEAGIVLEGTEIKSVRMHNINLKDSFITIKNNAAYIHNMHISPYTYGNVFNHNPTRTRKLLLHKKEILRLSNLVSQKGYTIIPLRIYIKNKYAKLEIALAKGRKTYNKKEFIKNKDIEREINRELKFYK